MNINFTSKQDVRLFFDGLTDWDWGNTANFEDLIDFAYSNVDEISDDVCKEFEEGEENIRELISDTTVARYLLSVGINPAEFNYFGSDGIYSRR